MPLPYLKIKDIPNKDKGKQLWFWIVIKDRTLQINLSGLSTPISVSHPDFRDPKADLRRIIVSKTPLTIKRVLITKTLYNGISDVYEDVREFERSEGTVI